MLSDERNSDLDTRKTNKQDSLKPGYQQMSQRKSSYL